MDHPVAHAGGAPGGAWGRCCSAVDDDGRPIPWIKTDAAETIFAGLILLNAVVLGIDIEVGIRNGGQSHPVLFWIQFGFLVAFVVELILRLAADWRFVMSFYGLFDALVIVASIAEYALMALLGGTSPRAAVSVMRTFRVLRIARVARVLHVFPELALLISGLAASMRAVFWVFCFLVVIMYIGALVCAMELGQIDDPDLRDFFGSVGKSFYTHFMVVTLEGYPAVASAAGQQSAFWYVYIVCFILFTSMVLMNLVTGVVCDSVVNHARDEELASCVYEAESAKFKEVLEELLVSMGHSSEKEISLAEFKELIRSPPIREALNTLDICLEIDEEDLFQIVDEDGSESLSFHEVFSGLLRLRGSKDALHSLLVQCDLCRHSQRVRRELCASEESLGEYAESLIKHLGKKLRGCFEDLRTVVDSAAAAASSIPAVSSEDEANVEKEPGPWSTAQRFRLQSEHEKDVLVEHVSLLSLDSAHSVTEAVDNLNSGALQCSPGCCIVFSKSSGAFFLLYRSDALHFAHDALAKVFHGCDVDFHGGQWPSEDAKEACLAVAGHDPVKSVGSTDACDSSAIHGAGKNEDLEQIMLPTCVQDLLEAAESGSAEMRMTLSQLGAELEASRTRVRQLEARLRCKSEEVQTDEIPAVAIARGGTEESPCWLEDDEAPSPQAAVSVPEAPILSSSEATRAAPQSTCASMTTPGERRHTERRRQLEALFMSSTAPHAESPKMGGLSLPSPQHLETHQRVMERYYRTASPEQRRLSLTLTRDASDSGEDRESCEKGRRLSCTRRLRKRLAGGGSPSVSATGSSLLADRLLAAAGGSPRPASRGPRGDAYAGCGGGWQRPGGGGAEAAPPRPQRAAT